MLDLLQTLRDRGLKAELQATCGAVADAGERCWRLLLAQRPCRATPAGPSNCFVFFSLPPTVAQLADNLDAVSALLSSVLEARGASALARLPSADTQIGCYRYDGRERGRDMMDLYARLEAVYIVSC